MRYQFMVTVDLDVKTKETALKRIKSLLPAEAQANIYDPDADIRDDIQSVLEGHEITKRIPRDKMNEIIERVYDYDYSDYNDYIWEQILDIMEWEDEE